MIVGKGLIASLFTENDSDQIIFFASGVSNSSETQTAQFKREEDLLLEYLKLSKQKIFIYFSTCSIYDSSKSNSPYVLHKLHMEELVKSNSENYLILRVSNAVGRGGNPNLLLNYIMNAVQNQHQITVHTKATRNLIDAEDIKNLTLDLIKSNNYNRIVNIAYTQNFTMIEILQIIEQKTGKPSDLILEKKGESYNISVPDVEDYFVKNNLTNKDNYLANIISKYYI